MNISELNVSNIDCSNLNSTQITHLVGSIMYFAYGSNAVPPSGWLHCNGSAISRTTYADLFSVIGTKFGSGDGSTTFNVPDTRGRFIRCCPLGSSNDPDNTTQDVGATQGEAIKRLTGNTDCYQCDYDRIGWWGGTNGSYYNSRFGGSTDSGDGGDRCGWTDFYASRSSLTGQEFRPRNHALYACIKY